MRGVYGNIRKGLNVMVGSSPHARGLLPRPAGRGRGDGIIPACAGFTRPPGAPRCAGWDHPRMRGVYSLALPDEDAETGSSPHARGLPPPCVSRPWAAGDHPRMRGVYGR